MIKNKFAIGALAAATVASTLAMSNPAEAGYYYRRGGWNPGAAAAVGAIGGLALGAALAAPRPAYGYPAPVYGAPAYAPAPVYVEPAPRCWVQRQRVWDGWGWVWQRQRVCDY